jgi:hypothetical protein
MNATEKINLIIEQIAQAKNLSVDGMQIELVQSDATGLTKVPVREIHSVLKKLAKEHALKIVSLPTYLVEKGQRTTTPRNYFTLKLLPDFTSWYEGYLLREKSALSNLDYLNFIKIYDLLLDIENYAGFI